MMPVETQRTKAFIFSSTISSTWGRSVSDVNMAKSFLVSKSHTDSSRIKVSAKIVDARSEAVDYPKGSWNNSMSSGPQKSEDFSHMLDNSHLVMSDEQWSEFSASLEEPPRELSNLRKLFSKPTVFD